MAEKWDGETRSVVCNFNVEPSLKAEFYDGVRRRGLSATFLFRKVMLQNVDEFRRQDAKKEPA